MIEWKRYGARWYTADGVGGICWECENYPTGKSAWYFWPIDATEADPIGPYKTLKEAKVAVEWLQEGRAEG